jgi:hypothetical protein
VEFGVEIGEYRGMVRVRQRMFQRLLPERPPNNALRPTTSNPSRAASRGSRAEGQVTEDGNMEISGRDPR